MELLNKIRMVELIEKLELKKGDCAYISSNFLRISSFLKEEKKKIDLNNFIDSLIEKVGKDGSIFIPTFNWDFCNGKGFHYLKSKSLTGALGNAALKRKDFKRTKNPIYSFMVAGKNKEEICELSHKSCFGLDSPFGYLIKHDAKQIFIDTKIGFTLVHVAEENVSVPYRFKKEFKGLYIDDNNNRFEDTYFMYVRDYNSKVKWTKVTAKFWKVLNKRNAFRHKVYKKIHIRTVKLKEAYNLAINDLKNNKGYIQAVKQ